MTKGQTEARIAVASRSFSKNAILREELLRRYSNVTFNDLGISLNGDNLLAFLRGHEKAIVALEPIDAALLAQLPDLKVISKYGVGLDNIDIQALAKHGKRLGWRGGVNKRSVSELALAMMIAALHCVPQASAEIRGGRWRQIQGRQLTGKTIGIVGCGHVGKDLVALLKPFDCRILVHDIVHDVNFFEQHGVTETSLDVLLANSDIVTLHVPFDASTANLIGAERLKLMKREAILINTARGGIVDEAALKEALLRGDIFAAAFDVFAAEPPTDVELLGLPNFLVTPHIGGSAIEAVLAMGRAAIAGLDDAP